MKGVSMTENEAKSLIEWFKVRKGKTLKLNDKGIDYVVQALEEVQAYRKIGLTPELIEAMQGHNIALINDLAEYQEIGTVEKLKALKDKSEPKKPRFYAHNYYCTECGNLVGNNEFEWQRFLYCDKCGQKLDWE